MNATKTYLLAALLTMLASINSPSVAREIRTLTTGEDTEIEVRTFPANGDTLLLGFPCDEGAGVNQEATARVLEEDGVEIWMPDLLTAYMLPKTRSSLHRIPDDVLMKLLEEAVKTGKKVFLIASGPDGELVLRAAALWERKYRTGPRSHALQGAILLYPRLLKGKPEPGREPRYIDAVGKTRLPIMVLEGERTPNRWGIGHLTNALKAGGSDVYAKLIPKVRGYFVEREDTSPPEAIVARQLPGLIKASLYFLKGGHHEYSPKKTH